MERLPVDSRQALLEAGLTEDELDFLEAGAPKKRGPFEKWLAVCSRAMHCLRVLDETPPGEEPDFTVPEIKSIEDVPFPVLLQLSTRDEDGNVLPFFAAGKSHTEWEEIVAKHKEKDKGE